MFLNIAKFIESEDEDEVCLEFAANLEKA